MTKQGFRTRSVIQFKRDIILKKKVSEKKKKKIEENKLTNKTVQTTK